MYDPALGGSEALLTGVEFKAAGINIVWLRRALMIYQVCSMVVLNLITSGQIYGGPRNIRAVLWQPS